MSETPLDFTRRALYSIRRRTIGDRHLRAYYSAISYFGPKKPFPCIPSAPWGYGYTIEKVCAELGFKVSGPLSTAQVGIYFVDETFAPVAPETPYKLLNARCTDISKKNVERIFETVFGYPLAIDPLTYEGLAAKKSNLNAAHDGTVVKCPVDAIEPNCVYERLINNVHGHLVEDIRLPVVGNALPFAYLKYRFIKERFSNNNRRIKRVKVGQVFSDAEQQNIRLFVREINLDYGELDILRDKDSGKIYIVDVNKTPGGPPAFLSAISRIAAAKTLARAFKAQFLI